MKERQIGNCSPGRDQQLPVIPLLRLVGSDFGDVIHPEPLNSRSDETGIETCSRPSPFRLIASGVGAAVQIMEQQETRHKYRSHDNEIDDRVVHNHYVILELVFDAGV